MKRLIVVVLVMATALISRPVFAEYYFISLKDKVPSGVSSICWGINARDSFLVNFYSDTLSGTNVVKEWKTLAVKRCLSGLSINDEGNVAGVTTDPNDPTNQAIGAYWKTPSSTPLPIPLFPTWINNKKDVVGWNGMPLLYSVIHDTLVGLAPLGGIYAEADCVDDRGRSCGFVIDSPASKRWLQPVIWNNDGSLRQMIDLPYPFEDYEGTAPRMNNRSRVLVLTSHPVTGDIANFIYHMEQDQFDLVAPGVPNVYPFAIDNLLQVGGQIGSNPLICRPFVWSKSGGLVYLPLPTGARGGSVQCGNNGRVFGGYYVDRYWNIISCIWVRK